MTANGGDEHDDDPSGTKGVRPDRVRRDPAPFADVEIDEPLTDLLFGEPYQRPRPHR